MFFPSFSFLSFLFNGLETASCPESRRCTAPGRGISDETIASTKRKIIGFLPNLQEFTFEQVRMKPSYIDLPPFEWQEFYANMRVLQETLEGVNSSLKTWIDNPPRNVDPEVLTSRTTNLATEMLKVFSRLSRRSGR